jgi:hypothetical protein
MPSFLFLSPRICYLESEESEKVAVHGISLIIETVANYTSYMIVPAS